MRRTKSIYLNNFLNMVSIILVSFIVLGLFFGTVSYQFFLNEKKKEMSTNAVNIVDNIVFFINNNRIIISNSDSDEDSNNESYETAIDNLQMRGYLVTLSYLSHYDILITNTDGVILSCSDENLNSEYLKMTVPDSIISALNDSGTYSGVSNLGGVYRDSRYVVANTLRSVATGEVKYYVVLSSDFSTMVSMWRQFSLIFLFAGIAAVILAFSVSVVTTRKQTKPINEMALAAHRFARGDFSVRISETGRQDEIGELADAFNNMSDSMERSEKLRRDLIGNVSHELKTPMTTIIGFADGIIDGTIPPEKQNEYLKVVSSEAKRLSRLVRRMLEVSQIQAMNPEMLKQNSFDISEIIRRALLSLEQKITSRGLDVDAQLPEEPIITLGDPDSIMQVVYNLIDNATKFAEPKSVITISLWKQAGKAYVSVENTGDEIEPEELPLIFDRFHKTDKSRSEDREGVGLGLYIVKTILDNHNEDIFVTSAQRVTKFMFTLTLKQEK